MHFYLNMPLQWKYLEYTHIQPNIYIDYVHDNIVTIAGNKMFNKNGFNMDFTSKDFTMC